MKSLIIYITFFSTLLFSNIIDINSQKTSIFKAPKSIIAIGPGALRLVTIMNLQNRVIGIEKVEQKAISFSEYRTVLGKKMIISTPIIGVGGPGKLPNLEKIIMLNPDMIITSFIGKKQLELIHQKTKIPILSLSYGLGYGGSEQKLEAIKKSLLLLGRTFNKEKRSQEVISFMDSQENEFKTYKIKNKNLYIGGIGFKGAHGITSSEKNYPSFELLNIINPLTISAKTNHMFIQKESLLTQNPNMIFLDMFAKKIIKEDFIKQKKLYKSLNAYKNNKIYWLLPYNFYNTNIANVYINSWIILQKLGHNIDIEAKMSEIYDIFYEGNSRKLLKNRYPIASFK